MKNISIDRDKIWFVDIINVSGGITGKDLYDKYKPDYMINLGMYTSGGINFVRMDDENIKTGYLGSSFGLGIKGRKELVACTYQKAYDSTNIREYISGFPTLRRNNQVAIDWGNKYSSYIDGRHNRSVVGFTNEYLNFYFFEQATVEEIANTDDIFSMNCDGGGSCHLQDGENVIQRSTRKNASWLVVYMEDNDMTIVLNDVRLTENFKLSELVCKDGSNKTIFYQEDIEKLQKIRDFFGKPITIVSAYRTKEYNTLIGGAVNSFHLLGRAYDIKIHGVSSSLVAYIAIKMGFKGIGIYKTETANFTHVDSREEERLFRDDIYNTETFAELAERIEK